MSSVPFERLRVDARRADDLRREAHRLLVDSARAGRSAGMTQRQIAEAMSRSQPEISRLLRFHGTTPLARDLERNRSAIIARLVRAGGSNPRVFGSVGRGEDGPDSDVDLVVDFRVPLSLFELADVESDLSELLGVEVDIVPSHGLRDAVRTRVSMEAVPL